MDVPEEKKNVSQASNEGVKKFVRTILLNSNDTVDKNYW